MQDWEGLQPLDLEQIIDPPGHIPRLAGGQVWGTEVQVALVKGAQAAARKEIRVPLPAVPC